MMILVVILQALIGLSFTIGKVSLSHGSPCFIIATRMLIGGIALLFSHSLQQGAFIIPHRSVWKACLPYALSGVFGFPLLRAWGLQSVPSAKAAIFFALVPLSTALIAYLIQGERLSMTQVGGLLLGCCGIIPLVTRDGSIGSLLSSFSFPELSIICSVILLSASAIIMQMLVRDHGHTPLIANGISMLIGGALALSSSCITEPLWIHGNGLTLALLIGAQVIISNIICANIQAFLLTRYSATIMSLASFISPIMTIIYGVVFLQENVTWHLFFALSMIAIGLFCYHADHLRQKRELSTVK